MFKQSLTELLPINQINIDNATARKIITSYATAFNELETICQLMLEFSKEKATLNETKFRADMDSLIRFGTNSMDLLGKDEYEKTQLAKVKVQLQAFITCFNQLDQLQRTMIYYSYIKNESAVKIAKLRLFDKQAYSVRTLYRKNNEASILLAKKIKWYKIQHNF